MNKTSHNYYKKEKNKLKTLEKYNDKIKFLNKKELNNLEKID